MALIERKQSDALFAFLNRPIGVCNFQLCLFDARRVSSLGVCLTDQEERGVPKFFILAILSRNRCLLST